jgi:hypothetical protein
LDIKWIFITISSIITVALLSMNLNFVSATTECFGDVNQLGSVICTATQDDGSLYVFECTVTQNPYHVDCHDLRKASVPPGVKADIDASIKVEVQSFNHNTKNLGDLKKNNLPDLSTQERNAGDVPKQLQFPNKTQLSP